jgi:chitinase
MKKKLSKARWTLCVGLISLSLCGTAQVSPTVPNTTKDHKQQVIGYITQWDAWKGDLNGIPKTAYNFLNVDYSQYTLLNFSFFGVAVDGSLHSADLRNKQIYQSGVDQAPGKMINDDIYSSFDEFFLKGDVQTFYNVDAYLKGIGYVDNGDGTWKNTNTGETGSIAAGIIEIKQTPAYKSLITIAHEKGVKVMASIGGWSMCKHYGSMAADPAKRKKFTDGCKKLIGLGFDGIDIDWEYPGRSGMNFTGGPQDFNNYAILMEEIRTAIGPGKLITGCFSAVIKPNEFDWARLDKTMDYFNMMTYDFNGGWSNKAGHNSPLYDYPGAEYAGLSLDNTLQGLKQQNVNLSKVNLGVAFYGRSVICSGSADLNAATVKTNVTVQPDGPISSCADFDNYKLDVWDGTPNYSYIMNNASGWTEKWDDKAKVPYKTNGKYFLSYDNVKSIGLKADYIRCEKLGGVIIWQVFGDMMNMNSGTSQKGKFTYCPNTTSPLVNEINRTFALKTACLTGVDDVEKKNNIGIFPNPSTGVITIQGISVGANEASNLKIYNMLGQTVYSQGVKTTTVQLDLSAYEKGIYFIQVQNGGEAFSQKIVLE